MDYHFHKSSRFKTIFFIVPTLYNPVNHLKKRQGKNLVTGYSGNSLLSVHPLCASHGIMNCNMQKE